MNNANDELLPCPSCLELIPHEVLCAHRGVCMNCAVRIYSVVQGPDWKTKFYQHVEKIKQGGYCQWCCRKLVPIGNARENGRPHDDWNTRRLHKKCWIEMKRY
jgi:hypothetical protein